MQAQQSALEAADDSALRFAAEPLEQWLHEAAPMMQAHWHEVELDHDKIQLKPDYDRWLLMEAHRATRSYVARDGAGRLAGYLAFLFVQSLAYRAHVFALCELIYLAPEHRRGYNAARFIRFARERLQADGASKIFVHVPLSHDFGAVLEREGFRARETVYDLVLI